MVNKNKPKLTVAVRIHNIQCIEFLDELLFTLSANKISEQIVVLFCLQRLNIEDEIKPLCSKYELACQFLHTEAPGDQRSALMKRAIQECHTKYFSFLDYDDIPSLQGYHKSISILESSPELVATLGRIDAYTATWQNHSRLITGKKNTYYTPLLHDYLFTNPFPIHGCVLKLEQKKECIANYVDEKLSRLEDYWFFLNLVTNQPCEILPKEILMGNYFLYDDEDLNTPIDIEWKAAREKIKEKLTQLFLKYIENQEYTKLPYKTYRRFFRKLRKKPAWKMTTTNLRVRLTLRYLASLTIWSLVSRVKKYFSSKKKDDLVSVLIPAYNHAGYVNQTIYSIAEQTYKNIELIIIDDGSTDNTKQIIEQSLSSCRGKLTRVEFISKPNEGLIKTLNQGIEKAHGDYLYMIASDDIAEPDAIETLHAFLSKNKRYGLAVGDNSIIDGDSKRCYWTKEREITYNKLEAAYLTFGHFLQKHRADIDFSSDTFGSYEALLQGNHIPNGYLIRKNLIDKIGGYSIDAPLEDFYIMLQLSKITSFKFINKPLFRYRWHETNTIKQCTLMEEFAQMTLRNEIPYAEQHGLLHLIKNEHPIEKKSAVTLLGVKVLEFKKKQNRTKIPFCNICLYKNVIRKKKRTISILGIPFFKK